MSLIFRHSRAGGNPVPIKNRTYKTRSFHSLFVLVSRLRGNDALTQLVSRLREDDGCAEVEAMLFPKVFSEKCVRSGGRKESM